MSVWVKQLEGTVTGDPTSPMPAVKMPVEVENVISFTARVTSLAEDDDLATWSWQAFVTWNPRRRRPGL